MIVIANLFRKLQTVKDLVKPPSKKSPFRTTFKSQHVKGSSKMRGNDNTFLRSFNHSARN